MLLVVPGRCFVQPAACRRDRVIFPRPVIFGTPSIPEMSRSHHQSTVFLKIGLQIVSSVYVQPVKESRNVFLFLGFKHRFREWLVGWLCVEGPKDARKEKEGGRASRLVKPMEF